MDLAWLWLADQVLYLVQWGPRVSDEPVEILVSVVAGALVVGWFSAGVLRARMVRLVIVWVLLGLALLGHLVVVFGGEAAGWPVVHLVMTGLQVVVLWSFCNTGYFRGQRAARQHGPPLGSILAIAILVGALGGITANADPYVSGQIRIGV